MVKTVKYYKDKKGVERSVKTGKKIEGTAPSQLYKYVEVPYKEEKDKKEKPKKKGK